MSADAFHLPPLTPGYRAGIEFFPAFDLDDDNLADVRALMAAELPYENAFVTQRDLRTPPRGEHPGVEVRIYEPTSPVPSGGRPALVWIHGGGYVMGEHHNDAELLGRIAVECGVMSVSVRYRLAPEHPFPAPLEDCYTALGYVIDQADELEVDPARVGVGGLSAGGGIAAALALTAHDRGDYQVAFQLLDSPMIDDRIVTPSSRSDALPVWSRRSNEFAWNAYLGSLSGAQDVPYHAAPARALDLFGLPPTLILVGTVDGFRDEDIDYAARLARAGVPVELHVYDGAPHAYRLFPGELAVEQSLTDITRWITARVAR